MHLKYYNVKVLTWPCLRMTLSSAIIKTNHPMGMMNTQTSLFFLLLLQARVKQTKGTKHDVSACESCVWRPKQSQDIKHFFIRITVHNVQ